MSFGRLLPLPALLLFAGVFACSSSDSTSSSSSSSGSSGSSGGAANGAPVAVADCTKRCSSKLQTCGAPAGQADSGCASNSLCGSGTITSSQLTCFEGKACSEILATPTVDALCPAASGTTSSSSSTSSGSSTGGAKCGAATCSATQFCKKAKNPDGTGEWQPQSCETLPSSCAAKTGADQCTCMKSTAWCPTGGVIVTDCEQQDGALSFGCMNL